MPILHTCRPWGLRAWTCRSAGRRIYRPRMLATLEPRYLIPPRNCSPRINPDPLASTLRNWRMRQIIGSNNSSSSASGKRTTTPSLSNGLPERADLRLPARKAGSPALVVSLSPTLSLPTDPYSVSDWWNPSYSGNTGNGTGNFYAGPASGYQDPNAWMDQFYSEWDQGGAPGAGTQTATYPGLPSEDFVSNGFIGTDAGPVGG
jgi:hypothetical protein